MTTLQAAFFHDVGSDRHLNLSVRLGELEKDAPATFDSKCGESMAHMMNGFFATGMAVHKEKPDRTQVQPPSVQQAKEGFDLCVVQRVRSQLDAKLLTQDPIKKRFMTLYGFDSYGLYGFLVHNRTASIELEKQIGGEAALTQAIEEYDFHVDGPVYKEIGSKVDLFRGSCLLPPHTFTHTQPNTHTHTQTNTTQHTHTHTNTQTHTHTCARNCWS